MCLLYRLLKKSKRENAVKLTQPPLKGAGIAKIGIIVDIGDDLVNN